MLVDGVVVVILAVGTVGGVGVIVGINVTVWLGALVGAALVVKTATLSINQPEPGVSLSLVRRKRKSTVLPE